MNLKDVNYIDYGKDLKGCIVLLHGWGQNIEMMDMLGHPFENEYRIIVLDLPGFGMSKEPNTPWNVGDYTNFLHNMLDKLNVDNPILIGHSFGGRIAIMYSSLYKCKKVVLLSSPFRPVKNSKVSFKTKIYKFVKKVKVLKPLQESLAKKWGSSDYNNASIINKGTLVKVINEDLTSYAKKITCPVLLIYGDCDIDVPLEEGKTLERLIPDAGLVVYENLDHYAYLKNLNKTINILKSFFD